MTALLAGRLVGLGWRAFLADRTNVFETALTLPSCALVVLSSSAWSSTARPSSSFVVLRAFALTRLLRMTTRFATVREIAHTIVASARDMAIFGLVVCLFLIVFGLIGVQLFKGRMTFAESGLARNNYEHIGWAMVTVFQVMTPENCNQVIADSLRAVGYGGVLFQARVGQDAVNHSPRAPKNESGVSAIVNF